MSGAFTVAYIKDIIEENTYFLYDQFVLWGFVLFVNFFGLYAVLYSILLTKGNSYICNWKLKMWCRT